jgi:two-component sensor histidine kinase
MLNPELVQPMAIALHKLATNSVKYGSYPWRKKASPVSWKHGVHVEWALATDGRLVLRWTEVGGPLVKPPTRSGFGTNVMEAMIREHLKGEVRLDWRAEGLACETNLPTLHSALGLRPLGPIAELRKIGRRGDGHE